MFVPRNGASTRARLGLIAIGCIAILGLWGFGHGPISHAMSYEIQLNWSAPLTSVRPISGYNVYRAIEGSPSFEKLNSEIVTQTKFADDTVTPGRTYDYFVKSIDATSGTESDASGTIRLTVPWKPHFVHSGEVVAHSRDVK